MVALENLALRHQLGVLKRSVKRPRLVKKDRILWVLLCRFWHGWKDSLVIVKPDTVVRWHRKGFRVFWTWKSRRKRQGRPPIPSEVKSLIRKMALANRLWGAPRIHGELLNLGFDIAQATISKYMPRIRKPPSQTWRTFLMNHMDVTAACDFFVVPTVTFRLLFCFVVLSHSRRRIVHFNATRYPSAEWTTQQIVEAFPGDDTEPRFLIRDRDGIYGDRFRKKAEVMDIEEVLIAPHSPWQNPYCERVIGSIRRECFDHVIVLGEKHLLRIMREYVSYYNECRTHLSLGKDSPTSRTIEFRSSGKIVAIPKVGGLHHLYKRVA